MSPEIVDGHGTEQQLKALSIRRPWANLIASGVKLIENRTWSTRHRGFLVIHGSRAWDPAGACLAVELGYSGFEDRATNHGGYLALSELVDVHPSRGCCAPWGEPSPSVYHWVLAGIRSFAEPYAAPGRLGLFNIPTDHQLELFPPGVGSAAL